MEAAFCRAERTTFVGSMTPADARQRLEHNEADYRAVMACREHLRVWSGDDWPEDDFTLEQNHEDLAGHIDDAKQGFAYGYTVFRPDGSVAGSVYLYPAPFFADRYAFAEADRREVAARQALIDYWLMPTLEDGAEHAAFLAALRDWLAADWGYATAVWPSRPGMVARRRLYDRFGFRPLPRVTALHTPGWQSDFHLS